MKRHGLSRLITDENPMLPSFWYSQRSWPASVILENCTWAPTRYHLNSSFLDWVVHVCAWCILVSISINTGRIGALGPALVWLGRLFDSAARLEQEGNRRSVEEGSLRGRDGRGQRRRKQVGCLLFVRLFPGCVQDFCCVSDRLSIFQILRRGHRSDPVQTYSGYSAGIGNQGIDVCQGAFAITFMFGFAFVYFKVNVRTVPYPFPLVSHDSLYTWYNERQRCSTFSPFLVSFPRTPAQRNIATHIAIPHSAYEERSSGFMKPWFAEIL